MKSRIHYQLSIIMSIGDKQRLLTSIQQQKKEKKEEF